MAAKSAPKKVNPPQSQKRQPGLEHQMHPQPDYQPRYPGSNRLKGKVAIISGGDSGIGRAVSVLFAREGAKVAILYLNEDRDAKDTAALVEAEGGEALLIKGDIGKKAFAESAVKKVIISFGRLDIVINNAAEQQTSITAYRGSPTLMDYSSTKGAILSFTRTLSGVLAKKGIRVNGVAPGPIWTPLIPASFGPKKVAEFGATQPLGRPGQPNEVAPSYLFLACDDASYITGQVLPPNGGEVTNG